MSELDPTGGEQPKETPQPSGEGATGPQNPAPQDPAKKDPDVLSKEQQLANVNKAINEANIELKRVRDLKKAEAGKPAEDSIPKIDMEDPSSKAWDKHIKETVAPVNAEMDAEKQEIFQYSLRDFLKDKPVLAGNSERLKSFVQTYERIRSSTGRTKEGVLLDLQRAFGAEFHEELTQRARQNRTQKIKDDILFSDAGVSSSSGSYLEEREPMPKYSEEDRKILARWGMSPEQHATLEKELREKTPTE